MHCYKSSFHGVIMKFRRASFSPLISGPERSLAEHGGAEYVCFLSNKVYYSLHYRVPIRCLLLSHVIVE